MLSDKKTTGIFGGSFNPIHNGHIALARQILEKGGLDEIWFMVSPQNPLKPADTLADDHYRLSLVKAALEGEARLKACDYEFQMPRPSYTYDTLMALRRDYPDREFTLIMGGDNWERFHRWYKWEDILRQFRIIIYPRQGAAIDTASLPANVRLVDTLLYNISSTEIRNKISKGEDISRLVPEAVAKSIRYEED